MQILECAHIITYGILEISLRIVNAENYKLVANASERQSENNCSEDY